MLKYITLPDNLLPPVSPYSHAVRAGDLLFVTGQLGADPQTGEIIRGPVDEQTRRVMENLKIVLDYTQTSFEQVVMARLFLTDFRMYDQVNSVYTSYFSPNRLPCRTTVGVLALAGLGDVEIDLVVYCGAGS